MKIVYQGDTDNKYIQVTDPKLDAFAQNYVNYVGLHVKGTINNGTPIEQTILTTNVAYTSGVFYMDIPNKILYITPRFFSLSAYTDSVIKIEVKVLEGEGISPGGGYFVIQNCIFVDVTFKCKVASLLQNIIDENEDIQNKEKLSTFIHLMHYGLTNGSNCGCNCAELVDIFTELSKQLISIDPKTVNPCGCE